MSRSLVVDLYARLSRCPTDGSLEKVDTQLADCEKVAIERGWQIGRRWDDPNLSAWKRDRKRPGWDALLKRVKSGEIDGVVCWHTDRLFRQPADLEQLITLADAHGLVLASAYGEHDIGNSDHRLALRINAAVACKSSDDTSRRLKRRFQSMREAGVGNGGARAFGFPGLDRTAAKDQDGKRPPVPAALVEQERAALLQGAKDLVNGDPVAVIAERWNAQDLLTAKGTTWEPLTVRAVLLRPRNAGLLEHNGVVVGRMPGDPILDETLFTSVRAVFAARRRGRVAGEKYLASGIVLCGQCGRPLTGRPHHGTHADGSPRRQYRCAKDRGGCGKVAADARRVDAWLRSFVLRRLGDPAHVAGLAAAAADTARRTGELAEQITKAQTLRQQLADRLGRGEMDLDIFDAASRPLGERIARLEAERDALAAEPAGALPDPDISTGEVARRWNEGDVAERRTMLLTASRGWWIRLQPANGKREWSDDRLETEPIRR